MSDRFMTVPELADLLEVSRGRTYEIVRVGPPFPVVRLSPRRIRIERAGVEAWLAERTRPARVENGR